MARELKPCGTRAAYERHRRRGEPIDDACHEANEKESATRRAAGFMPPGATHGLSGYINYGCKCEVCVAAGSQRNRAYRESVRLRRAAS